MKMNKYKCKCTDANCKLESNKRPTFCTYYSHISPDWQLVNAEVPNLENVEVKERWKPRKGERYFFICDIGFVKFNYWDNDVVDHDYYKFGNCFKTEEEAQRASEMVRKFLLSLHKDNVYSNDKESETENE